MSENSAVARSNSQEPPVDATRRETIKKLVATAAYAAPVVASFQMSGLAITTAHAQYSYIKS
jgi:hypothetical protein